MTDWSASHAYTCPGKVRYLARRHAKSAAKRLRKRGGDKLTAYRCQSCSQWHLGHQPAWARDTGDA